MTPIPKALRNAVWLNNCGEVFHSKCKVSWCKTIMSPFDFETGHNIPESKGGSTTLNNLRPICAQCNKSMGNRYTIDEFSSTFSLEVATKEEKEVKEEEDIKESATVETEKQENKYNRHIFNCFTCART